MKKLLSLAISTVLGTTTIPNINTNIQKELINSNYNIIQNNINYSFNDSYNGFFSDYKDSSDVHTLLTWSDYADSWDNFTKKYPTFNFDEQSIFKISLSTGKTDFAKLNSKMKTENINENRGPGNTNGMYLAYIYTMTDVGNGGFGNSMTVSLNIWHEENYIHSKWFLKNNANFGRDSYFDIKLNKIFFE